MKRAMRKTLLSLILTILVAGVAAAAPAPFPLKVDSFKPTVKKLEVHRANARTIRVSFFDGTNASVLGASAPFLAWATNSLATTTVTSLWSAVSGMTGVVDFTWSTADLNHAPGRFFYEVGLRNGSSPTVYRDGDFVISGSPLSTGAADLVLTTPLNLDLFAVSGTYSHPHTGIGTTGTVTSATGDAEKFYKGDATWGTPSGSGDITAVNTGVGLEGGFTSGAGTLTATNLNTRTGQLEVQTNVYVTTESDPVYAAGSNDWLRIAKNLSDLANAATARSNLGLDTADSPHFTAVNIGHASDTTLFRLSAGVLSVEGNTVYHQNGTDVVASDGGTGASILTDGGVLLGSGTGAITPMAVLPDGAMIVGDGTTDPVAESNATLRTSIGVGTADNPEFAAVNFGHATDTTLFRLSAGLLSVEGNIVYHQSGTDVVAGDGGTGVSTLTDGGVLLGSGTGAITPMAVLADGAMIVGDGTTDPVAESGATLRTSIGVGTGDSPQFASGAGVDDSGTVTLHIDSSNASIPRLFLERSGGYGVIVQNSGANFEVLLGGTIPTVVKFKVQYTGEVFAPDVYDDTVTSSRDLEINSSGQLGYVSSSRDTKTNITDLTDTSWIHALEVKEYNRPGMSTNFIEAGLIAEDVVIALPPRLKRGPYVSYKRIETGSVVTNGITNVVYGVDYTTPVSVNYSRLVPVLLREVQRLSRNNSTGPDAGYASLTKWQKFELKMMFKIVKQSVPRLTWTQFKAQAKAEWDALP